ncbi:MAG: PilC/PilY family type IV pilus protein, partial [Comamonas sp.]
ALFTWSTIGDTLKAHLNKASPTATADNDGQNRLNFLRGYRSQEAVTFRQRNSRLGDIVNSAAAYSAAPTTRYNTAAYRTFYDTNKNRTKAVFVGANDGMLHAFNSTTMDELFAYIPSWMAPKLSQLSNTNYNSSGHTSYVDAPPAVAEAQVGSDWKTVLVSGTGGGGQGVFALDVSNPSDFAADKVLWEFTDQNDADMGNVVSQPRIVKLRTSAPG